MRHGRFITNRDQFRRKKTFFPGHFRNLLKRNTPNVIGALCLSGSAAERVLGKDEAASSNLA